MNYLFEYLQMSVLVCFLLQYFYIFILNNSNFLALLKTNEFFFIFLFAIETIELESPPLRAHDIGKSEINLLLILLKIFF